MRLKILAQVRFLSARKGKAASGSLALDGGTWEVGSESGAYPVFLTAVAAPALVDDVLRNRCLKEKSLRNRFLVMFGGCGINDLGYSSGCR